MSYHRYDLPRPPETPLDRAASVVGWAVVAAVAAFTAAMMAVCLA